MSLRAIYSLRIFCDGDSIGKTDNADIGFYADDFTSSNPVIIGWSESTLAPSTDNTTVIDGLPAKAYAPIIINVSDLSSNYDIDSPVVNNDGVTITVANHDKNLMYIKSQGLELVGMKCRLSINFLNESGALTTSEKMFYGEIQNTSIDETTLIIECNNNKFSKSANLLNDNEILTIGELASTYSFQAHVKTIRNSNYKTLFTNSGQSSFMVVGGFDTITATTRTRTYQIFFKTSLPNPIDLSGWFMYVQESGTESKGEYRKILSSTEITGVNVDIVSITEASVDGYFASYNDGYYLQIELEGAFTEGLVVDLCTYVQFVHFSHSFTLSKNELTGTVDRLYNKVDDAIVQFGDYGYQCTLNTDGTIDLDVDYPIDDDTITTYSARPCTGLALIGNNTAGIDKEVNLREWVYEIGDESTSEPYKNMHDVWCINNNGGFVAGVFSLGGATVNITTNTWGNNANAFDRKLYFPYYSRFSNTYTAGKILVGIEFKLPSLFTTFNFKSVHLGLSIDSTCTAGIAMPEGILCLTKEKQGTAKKHFNMPLVHSAGTARINTIPPFYWNPNSPENYFYDTDWQWKTPENAPQTRFTGLELTKLQDIDTLEKYNKIDKVGLFFLRGAGTNISDTIHLREICVIFKHENSLSEVYV